jgi:hypothetical protein
MRTRHPQPSWPHVNSVPASFAIYSAYLSWDPVNPGDPVDNHSLTIYPLRVYGKDLDLGCGPAARFAVSRG